MLALDKKQVQSRIRGAKMSGSLIGESALIASVIAQACTDYMNGSNTIKQEVVEYFNGDVYKTHLEILDLPLDYLPELFTN